MERDKPQEKPAATTRSIEPTIEPTAEPKTSLPHLEASIKAIGGMGLIFLVGIIVYEVILRSFFHTSTDAAEEFAGYAVVLLTFFGACLAIRDNMLFQVRVVFKRLPSAAQKTLKLLYLLLSISVCSTLLVQAVKLELSSYSRGNVAPTTTATPLWMPQLILLIGIALLIIFLLERLWVALRSASRTGGLD